MKKIIAISLVAILAVGSVFAAVTLSGEAKGVFSYDIDNNWIGFEKPTTTVKASLEATTAELVNEGDVYATVKATLSFNTANSDKGHTSFTFDDFKINYAKIVGENWYVGIISAPAPTDFAASWEYNSDDDVRVNYTTGFESVGDNVYGIEVGVYDYVAGVKMLVDFDQNETKTLYGTLTTPEYTLADGLTIQAGATAGNYVNPFLGFGGKVAYATDKVTADVAGDFGFKFAEEVDFDFDVAANVDYAPVAASVYYASAVNSIKATQEAKYYGEKYPYPALNIDDENAIFIAADATNYLSAKVVTDLSSIDVPVSFTVIGQDLINTQYFDIATAVTAVENLTIDVNGGYWVKNEAWHAGVGASYVIDQVGTVAAGVKLMDLIQTQNAVDYLSANASLTNTTLVSGATLKLGYESGNLLAATPVVGKISASAQIKF